MFRRFDISPGGCITGQSDLQELALPGRIFAIELWSS